MANQADKYRAKIEVPLYTFTDAAYSLRMPPTTLRAWFLGQKGEFQKVLDLPDPKEHLLSFANLIESHILLAIRQVHRIPLPNVRQAMTYMSDKLPNPEYPDHPLLDSRLRLYGYSFLVDEVLSITDVSAHGQQAMRGIVEKFSQRIKAGPYGPRFYPYVVELGKEDRSSVTMDPTIQFGKPMLEANSVATFVIADRWRAGESVAELAEDYDVTPTAIEDALRYETYREAA